jgi:Tol biopolymer transport system component
MPMTAAVRVSMPGGSLACLVAATIACAACPAALAAADWVRLSTGLPFSNVQVDAYQLSPDGRWAVYIHDAEVDDARELWSVPVFGGVPGRISGLLPAGSEVSRDFQFTPDGATVVYRAPQDSLGVLELYSVPIRGGVATKLNGALAAGGFVTRFSLSPDGQRVVYRADQRTDEVYELFSVPTGGGAATVLNGSLVAGGDVGDFDDFRLTGDGQRVVYRADQSTDDTQELYSVPIAGGVVTKLNGALVAGGDVGPVFKIAANSQRVVYWADQQTDGVYELFSVPTGGGAATKLNGALVANGDVFPQFLQISANSLRVVYLADQQTDNVFELFSVPIAGGAVTKLNGVLVAGGFILDATISPDSQRVVYRADQATDTVDELFSVPILGGAVTRLNDPLVAGGDVSSFKISDDSEWVVYVADQEVDGLPTGHRAPIAGPAGSAERIWHRANASDPWDYAIDTPRGRVIVYGNQTLVDGIVRLWSFPLAGTPDPGGGEELVPASAFDPDGDVQSFDLYPDGTILYNGDQTTNGHDELYAVPAMVFWDGFEGGDTTAWSSAVP